MRVRRPRGNYYSYSFTPGTQIAQEVARQVWTLTFARAALDATGLPGYVEQWSERQQRRFTVAERDAQGAWSAINPLDGTKHPLP